MASTKKTFSLLVILIVVLSAAYFILGKIKTTGPKEAPSKQSSTAGSSNSPEPEFIPPVQFSGKIVAVDPGKKTLSVEADNMQGTPVSAENQKKTLLIGDVTKIISREFKDSETFSKELEAAKADAEKNKTILMPPAPDLEKTITLGDLKPEDKIVFSVERSENFDISNTRLTVTEIVIIK